MDFELRSSVYVESQKPRFDLKFILCTEDQDFRDQMAQFITQALAGNVMFVDGKTKFKKGDEFESDIGEP